MLSSNQTYFDHRTINPNGRLRNFFYSKRRPFGEDVVKPNQQPPSQDPLHSYEDTLVLTTRYGIIIGFALFSFFALFYWVDGYPIQTVWLNLAALFLTVISWVILNWESNNKLAAQFLMMGMFVSLVGPAIYTGGIISTNMIWLVFVPMVAVMLSGKRVAAIWGGISIATAIGFYVLDHYWHINFSVHPPQTTDHLVDLVSVLIVTIIASWINEAVKQRYMRDLEAAQRTLHRQARMDPLTQSDNRRSLTEQANQYLSSYSNSVLMMDIDFFKEINDTYGHSTGDQVLLWFSQTARLKLRQGDILARMGGDEFVIFLPHTDMPEALRIAERLREKIATTPAITAHGEHHVTTSIGVASQAPHDNMELETLLNHADHALYHAKQNGRNCVSTSDI